MRVIAPVMYEPLARAMGLQFVGVGTVEQFERIASKPELWSKLKGFTVVAEAIDEMLEPYYRAIVALHEPGRTILVMGTLAFGARVAQEKLGLPGVSAHTAPVVFRSVESPSWMPPLPVHDGLPRWWNRLVFAAVDLLAINPTAAGLNRFRASVGLGPVRRIFDRWIHSPDRTVGLFPAWYAPPASDWPAQTVLTGFPLYDEADISPIDGKLERFLAEGEPPIAFTPGSAMRHGRRFFASAVEACRMLGRRGLLVSRFSQHIPRNLGREMAYVRYAPFSRLLPRCAALVHHGGIGTTAQALAAGIPQLVMPMAYDQPDNARRLRHLGVAEALPARRFSPRAVAVALERVMDPIHRGACLVAKRRFDAENPLEKSAEVIEQTFRDRAEPHL